VNVRAAKLWVHQERYWLVLSAYQTKGGHGWAAVFNFQRYDIINQISSANRTPGRPSGRGVRGRSSMNRRLFIIQKRADAVTSDNRQEFVEGVPVGREWLFPFD
jgi:hypothetical protein